MSPEPSTPSRAARAREFRRILAEMLRIDRVRGGLVVAADRLKRTPFQTALFSSDNGTIFLGSSAVGFVVVLGDKEVNVGLVQWALRKALASLEGAWGSAQVHVPASPDDM